MPQSQSDERDAIFPKGVPASARVDIRLRRCAGPWPAAPPPSPSAGGSPTTRSMARPRCSGSSWKLPSAPPPSFFPSAPAGASVFAVCAEAFDSSDLTLFCRSSPYGVAGSPMLRRAFG